MPCQGLNPTVFFSFHFHYTCKGLSHTISERAPLMLIKKILASSLSACLLTAGLPSCAHKTNNQDAAAKVGSEGTDIILPPVVTQEDIIKAEQIANSPTEAAAAKKAADLVCDVKDPSCAQLKIETENQLLKAGIGAVGIAAVVGSIIVGKKALIKHMGEGIDTKTEAGVITNWQVYAGTMKQFVNAAITEVNVLKNKGRELFVNASNAAGNAAKGVQGNIQKFQEQVAARFNKARGSGGPTPRPTTGTPTVIQP